MITKPSKQVNNNVRNALLKGDNAMDIEHLPKSDIEDMFREVDPKTIPAEYIEQVRLELANGKIMSFSGDEFKEYLNMNIGLVGYIEVALDIQKFSNDIMEDTKKILLTIGQD